MSGVLFEDIFEVGKLNPDGKKFDRGELYFDLVLCTKPKQTPTAGSGKF